MTDAELESRRISAPVIAFFSAKRGVGTTSTVYHLAWMFSDLGVNVLAVDMDPQASLTTAFIGTAMPGSAGNPDSLVHVVNENLALAPSDLKIAAFEEDFAIHWQRALTRDEESFDVICRPWQYVRMFTASCKAQLALVDLGPNLSAINRAGLVAADHIVIPVAPDLLTVLGLDTLGSALRKWRGDWQERTDRAPSKDMELPAGKMAPLGYVVRPGVRLRAEENWINWIPEHYRKFILDHPATRGVSMSNDPEKLAILKPYRSLLEMAREARKPMFHLKPADGAIGAHLQSAEDVRKDFEALAKAIVAKANLPIAFAR
jgi:cellulose biosynthesis protein BcsQ